MQSAYLCIVFLSEAQKITFSRCFNLISNSRKNPRWRALLVTSLAPTRDEKLDLLHF